MWGVNIILFTPIVISIIECSDWNQCFHFWNVAKQQHQQGPQKKHIFFYID